MQETVKGLRAPQNLTINFKPSAKQYEVWKLLQPECHICGGQIVNVQSGIDRNGNPTYKPVCSKCGNENVPQLILAGGSAGGGKSWLGACWLIQSCIKWPEMRMVVARKTLKSLRESTWVTILGILKDWGFIEGENYKINNLTGELIFWNNSKIIMKDLAFQPSDYQYLRFGSMEIDGFFADEVGEVPERGIEILFSRIRHKTHETTIVPKALMSTNPCLGWVRSRFVLDDNGEPVKCRQYEYYCPYNIFDNPNPSFRRQYLQTLSRISNVADRERLMYGNWEYIDTNEAAAYWNFKGEIHLMDNLREKAYNPMKPLVLSWDFNVAPFMSVLAAQIDYENKTVYILEEITGKPEDKENNTPKLADKISAKYLTEGHLGGLIITGDPAGLARSTQTEEGVNNFSIILSHLSPALHASKKLLTKQPPQKTRLEFINNLFTGYNGWRILIDMRCHKLTEDLIYQKTTVTGEKDKSKITDPKLGVKYEKYGHMSDAFDYILTLFLSDDWKKFNSNGTSGITTFNGTPIYGSFEY